MEHKICRMQLKAIDATGVFEGYGAAFGNVDLGGDIIVPGAFAKSIQSIKESGRLLPALWQHDCDEPIGVYTELSEDEFGLKFTGKLVLEVEQAAEALALMKAGAVTGMSIGYAPVEYEFDVETGVRTLREVDLYEISPVTFPMNELARISGAKRGSYRPSLKEFERGLRELGLSKSDATTVASLGYRPLLRSESAPEEQAKSIVDVLQSFKLKPIGE